MDRRQLKTRRAIFAAFRALLEKKRYDHITVQDIIDEADVGRSTFYAHFETKDLLLDAMCGELFCHIFENDPCPWDCKNNNLEAKLTHTLWHIREERNDLSGMFLSDSSELFMTYFKAHLKNMFEIHINDFETAVPTDFLLNHLVASFAEAVKWWMLEGMKTPEAEVAKNFLRLTKH